MGVWGMGLRQSDEYCEVYEAFMSEYDCGAAVSDIRSQIIASYTEEFAEDDPILHDAFFAIAKAEWMCCEQSQELLNRVTDIIDVIYRKFQLVSYFIIAFNEIFRSSDSVDS